MQDTNQDAPLIDWDDAFDNSGYVAGSAQFAERWAAAAAETRRELETQGMAELDLGYGVQARNRLDLFRPRATPIGLILFVHGGYWHKLDNSYWSQLTRAALDAGWAMAIPSYTLAPQARIAAITREIAAALEFSAARIDGPIRLVGHSAGGHLVARMVCGALPPASDLPARLQKIVAVSGVFDLRPLLGTQMNEILHLDETEAAAESPALLRPAVTTDIVCWVGAGERPEFLRQTRLLGETWQAQGAAIREHYEAGKNHFSVIEALASADSALSRELLS